MNFHLFCSGGHSKQPWLWGLWLSPPFPTSFSVFPSNQSFLLASCLCTVWLADPNFLCVLEPGSKKIGLLQDQGTSRGTAKGLWGEKRAVKNRGWRRAGSLSTVLEGCDQKMCANVSQWSVCLSIHPSIPTVLRPAQEIITPKTKGLEIALQDQPEESVASFQTAWLLIHVASCPVQPFIYTLSNVSGHCPRTWTGQVFRGPRHGRI